MITFLNKIAKPASIQNVILFSHQGEILFSQSTQPSLSIIPATATALQSIISDLKNPQAATLHFVEGLIYLHKTPIGYIIIVMKDDRILETLVDACQNAVAKLTKKDVGKKVLLNMLDKAQDIAKPQFIRALIPSADKEVALALMKIIATPENLTLETRDDLLLVACQTLGYCSYFEATECLNAMLAKHTKGTYTLDPYVIDAAQLALSQLAQVTPETPQPPPAQKKDIPTVEKKIISRNTAAPPIVQTIPPLVEKLPEKKKIELLVAENKKTEALQVIIGLIKTATQNKQFDTAEALRDWLLQIEPMALAESIRATELIEESKVALIDQDFYVLWKSIVEILTTEEFIALYHAMDCRSYPNGEHIVKQGQIHSELFFVNTGRVQTYTHIEGREIPLQIIQEGGLLGHGTFFELSVWTSGAKSQGAEVYALSFDNLQTLEMKFPGIESKLSDYCSQIDTSTALLKKMRRSRRELERKVVSGKITFLLLGADGKKTNIEGRGNILDISQGGLCFIVHSSKRKNTHQLFGKQITLMIKRSNSKPQIERTGKILAVRDHDIIGNAYSVHVQFDTMLTGTEMREIVAFNK